MVIWNNFKIIGEKHFWEVREGIIAKFLSIIGSGLFTCGTIFGEKTSHPSDTSSL